MPIPRPEPRATNAAPAVPAGRSPFVAGVLSLIFPGLGQLYVGRPGRALAFAAAPILALALLGGLLVARSTRTALLTSVFSPAALQFVLLVDILVGVYRAAAVVDAWRLAARTRSAGPTGANPVFQGDPSFESEGGADGSPRRGLTVPRLGVRDLSVAGLLATLLVLSLGHVALARYDRIAYDTIVGITTPVGSTGTTGASGPAASDRTAGSAGIAGGAPSATPAIPPRVPWNGTGRLNILLLGTDHRAGDVTFNTDTMIVASVDPSTGAVAMFSVPRDTENVPLQPGTPAAAQLGGVYPYRINSLWSYAEQNPGLFPGSEATRGATALKGALGALLGIDIPYYVMVDFSGFQQVVDTLGGVMVDVQLPVQDFSFPAPDDRSDVKLYIPPGFQYMSGPEALQYARARHQTNDFDRSQRQQRVITSVRQQTDVLSLLDPNRLDALSTELRSAIHTDFPADRLPALLTVMAKVDTTQLRSFVFTPPTYETECPPAACRVHYYLHPNVPAIQAAVRAALSVDQSAAISRAKLLSEGATVWVESGTKDTTRAGAVADYLDYLGIGASVPPIHDGRADRSTYPTTVIEVYNGAGPRIPETIRVLEQTFGVAVVQKTDPSVTADVVVIVGAATPTLTVPSQ